MKTEIITRDTLPRAAEILRNGGLAAVPTETVYGLAADGLNAAAVAEIYEVKNRPEQKAISLLVSGMDMAAEFCADIPNAAYALAEAFWPGPLTMILNKSTTVPEIVTAGGVTVGVRCPRHDMTLELIRLARCPLAAPSANLSGQPSPKSARDVLDYFDGKIGAVVDGGQCELGIESTIVDLTVAPPRILRQGGLLREEIAQVLETQGLGL